MDLSAQHEKIRDDLQAAFADVLARGDFILGAAVGRFETAFGSYVGVEHAVGVASGTAAIALGLRAAGIGTGDEVIVPAHTYIASALGVIHAGATPVLCDVDADTGLVDLDAAADALTSRTAALLAVHLYGQACNLDDLATFSDRHGLMLAEDAAQAHGARWHGRGAGSVGTFSAFSFYPSKNLACMGDGGMICTNDAAVAGAARRLRHLGQSGHGNHLVTGFNERLDTLQAALLEVKLPELDAWNETRREAAGLYRRLLPSEVFRLRPREPAQDVYHLFPIRCVDREEVGRRLREGGIATGVHYARPVHHHPAMEGLSGVFPEAEAWAREELSLPMFARISPEQVETVADALSNVPLDLLCA